MANSIIIRVLLIGCLLIMTAGCAPSPKSNTSEPAANRMEQGQPGTSGQPGSSSGQTGQPTDQGTTTTPSSDYGTPTGSTK